MNKHKQRKETPVYTGVMAYFPNAIREVAKASYTGSQQHNPGKPIHWDKAKSQDEADCMLRHLMDHHEDPLDDDGVLHAAKVAWRALAFLERHLTESVAMPKPRYEESETDERMRNIGQNGNDGLHYNPDNYAEHMIAKSDKKKEHFNNCGCCDVEEHVNDGDGPAMFRNYEAPRTIYPGDIIITKD